MTNFENVIESVEHLNSEREMRLKNKEREKNMDPIKGMCFREKCAKSSLKRRISVLDSELQQLYVILIIIKLSKTNRNSHR